QDLLAGADLHGAVAACGAHELLDAPTCSVLDPVRDRHGREDDRQVGLDGVAGAVIDRPGGQVVFGHPEGLLDTPQLVISADDELCGLAGQVGGVALPSRQRANLARVRFTDLVAPVSWMKRLRLTGACPSTARWALAICSSMPRSVRRARSWRYW